MSAASASGLDWLNLEPESDGFFPSDSSYDPLGKSLSSRPSTADDLGN